MAEVRRPSRIGVTTRRQVRPAPPSPSTSPAGLGQPSVQPSQVGLEAQSFSLPMKPIWFALLIGAAAVSPFAVALVMAVVGAIAADETLRARCRHREQTGHKEETIDLTHIDLTANEPLVGRQTNRTTRTRRTEVSKKKSGLSLFSWSQIKVQAQQILCDPPRLTTILGAMGLPLISSSKGGVNALALSLPLLILIPLVNRLLTKQSGDPAEQTDSLIEMSWAFMASVTFGSLGAALVLIDRLDATTAIVLILLVAVYDLSNFLIGSGPGAGWEGPAAGVVAVAIAGFASWVAIGPSVGTDAIIAMVCGISILCPLGPALMSVLIRNDEQAVRKIEGLHYP